jgi:uncharacterized protein (TIGR03066 family)
MIGSQEGNAMKAVCAAVLVGLLLCVLACSSSSSTDDNRKREATNPHATIVGEWDSSDEETKRTLEFGKDGSLVIKQEGQPDMKGTYRFTGDNAVQLEFTRPRGEKVKEPMTAKVSPDELILLDRDKKAHQYKRHK